MTRARRRRRHPRSAAVLGADAARARAAAARRRRARGRRLRSLGRPGRGAGAGARAAHRAGREPGLRRRRVRRRAERRRRRCCSSSTPTRCPRPGCLDAIRAAPARLGRMAGARAAPGRVAGQHARRRRALPRLRLGGRPREPAAAVPAEPARSASPPARRWRVRRGAWDEVGGFEPAYFMYGEDLDLSLRLRLAGWGVGMVPEARVEHDYEFAKGDYKWFHLERNRWWMVLGDLSRGAAGAGRAGAAGCPSSRCSPWPGAAAGCARSCARRPRCCARCRWRCAGGARSRPGAATARRLRGGAERVARLALSRRRRPRAGGSGRCRRGTGGRCAGRSVADALRIGFLGGVPPAIGGGGLEVQMRRTAAALEARGHDVVASRRAGGRRLGRPARVRRGGRRAARARALDARRARRYVISPVIVASPGLDEAAVVLGCARAGRRHPRGDAAARAARAPAPWSRSRSTSGG